MANKLSLPNTKMNHFIVKILLNEGLKPTKIEEITGIKADTVRHIGKRVSNASLIKLETILMNTKYILLGQTRQNVPLRIGQNVIVGQNVPTKKIITNLDHHTWSVEQLKAEIRRLGLRMPKTKAKKKEILTKYYNKHGRN